MADDIDGGFNEDEDALFNLPAPLPDIEDGAVDGLNLSLNDGDDAQDGDDKKTGKKKKATKKRKLLLLNEQRLLDSERGINAVKGVFADVKFKGKGHEASDLKLMLHHYEHWAHRLFPKYPFEDFVDRVETLGTKRMVRVTMSRLRMGLDDDHEPVRGISDEEGSGERRPSEENRPNGETSGNAGFGVDVQSGPPPDPTPQLTADQLERIRKNREMALAKREAAMRARLQQHQLEQLEGQVNSESTPREETRQDSADSETNGQGTNAPAFTGDGDTDSLDAEVMDSEIVKDSEEMFPTESHNGEQTRSTGNDSEMVNGEKDDVEKAESINVTEAIPEQVTEDQASREKLEEKLFVQEDSEYSLSEKNKHDSMNVDVDMNGIAEEETQKYIMEETEEFSTTVKDSNQNDVYKDTSKMDDNEHAMELNAEEETQDYNMEEDTLEYKTFENTKEKTERDASIINIVNSCES